MVQGTFISMIYNKGFEWMILAGDGINNNKTPSFGIAI